MDLHSPYPNCWLTDHNSYLFPNAVDVKWNPPWPTLIWHGQIGCIQTALLFDTTAYEVNWQKTKVGQSWGIHLWVTCKKRQSWGINFWVTCKKTGPKSFIFYGFLSVFLMKFDENCTTPLTHVGAHSTPPLAYFLIDVQKSHLRQILRTSQNPWKMSDFGPVFLHVTHKLILQDCPTFVICQLTLCAVV